MTMFVAKVYVLIAFAVLVTAVLSASIREQQIIAQKLNSAPDKNSRCHDLVPYAVCSRSDAPIPVFYDSKKVYAWYYDSSSKDCLPAGWYSLTCKENQDLPKTKAECIRLCTFFPCTFQWFILNIGEYTHCEPFKR